MVNATQDTSGIPTLLVALGMTPVEETIHNNNYSECYVVMLEGRVLGRVGDRSAARFVDKLRMLKVRGAENVPKTLEIAFVPRTLNGQYPGIYLFTASARMMRPVYNIAAGTVELVGTFEQVYLNICVTEDENENGIFTHQELSETSFLSNLACLIPLPDFNQSPRNMYQCQVRNFFLSIDFCGQQILIILFLNRWESKQWVHPCTTGVSKPTANCIGCRHLPHLFSVQLIGTVSIWTTLLWEPTQSLLSFRTP